jgi:hypothetical protein
VSVRGLFEVVVKISTLFERHFLWPVDLSKPDQRLASRDEHLDVAVFHLDFCVPS